MASPSRLLIGLRPGHFATPFSQTPPYCLCISSIISIHLKDGPSMCPFGTLNQDMFAYIHHKPLSTQGSVSIG